jgi:hypothetical protein
MGEVDEEAVVSAPGGVAAVVLVNALDGEVPEEALL